MRSFLEIISDCKELIYGDITPSVLYQNDFLKMTPKLWSSSALKVYTDPPADIKRAVFRFCTRGISYTTGGMTKAERILLRSVC